MDLIALLSQESVIEKEQKKRHKFVPDLPELEGEATRAPKIKEDLFFENKDIYISKHNRYAAYPEHSHQFLELNYIVKGECRQIINGVPYLLKEGDILLMDTGSAHSIEALGKDDLLLNILFNNKSISINWLSSRRSFPERSSAVICRSCFTNWHVRCRTSTAKRSAKKTPFTRSSS